MRRILKKGHERLLTFLKYKGGGQGYAINVTTTDHAAGKFEAKLYDKILQEETGGHFGPINALAFNPDGKSFSIGGEDAWLDMFASLRP